MKNQAFAKESLTGSSPADEAWVRFRRLKYSGRPFVVSQGTVFSHRTHFLMVTAGSCWLAVDLSSKPVRPAPQEWQTRSLPLLAEVR